MIRAAIIQCYGGDETMSLPVEDPVLLSVASGLKRYASSTDWERHKENIRQLYLDKNEHLKEVMAIMGRDHGHFGSIKQYKNKLREWGFDTKYKRHQTTRKRNLKRPDRQATAEGWSRASQVNDCHFQAPNTQSANTHPLEAPEARNAVDQYSRAADGEGASTLNITDPISADSRESRQVPLRYRTSLDLSLAVGLRPGRWATPPISLEERVLSLAQRHIETSFTYDVWKVENGNVWTIMARTKEDLELPESYFDLIRSAVLLFQQGSTINGYQVLSKAFALVKPILKIGNVRALNFFWSSLVFLIQSNRTDIVVRLIRYICDMAIILVQPGHPVVQMFKLLTQINVLQLEPLVHNTWQITADAFQKQLPSLHPEYVRHQCDLIFRIYGKRDAATAERRLRALLDDCENTAQTLEISHLTVLNALGYNLVNSRDWVQAVRIGQKLEERAQLAQDTDLLVYQIGGMEIQARAFNELKLIVSAVRCLKQATLLIANEWGETDPWRIELMALQQNYLREDGDIESADKLQAEINSITERIDTD